MGGRNRVLHLLILILAAVLAACSSSPLPARTATPAFIPAASPTPSPVASSTPLTPAPTQAPKPTQASGATPAPTQTAHAGAEPTDEPLPDVFANVAIDYAAVYTGPAEVFEVLVTLTKGMAVTLTGRNEESTWYYVDLLLGQGGWMRGNMLNVEGEIEALEVLATPVVPTATVTQGSPPVISVRDINTLILQNFRLHENVIITVVQVGNVETAKSQNCVITDPIETVCGYFNLDKIGVQYRITAQGDQGSAAETLFTRE